MNSIIQLIQANLRLASTRQSIVSAYFIISPVGMPSHKNNDEWIYRC